MKNNRKDKSERSAAPQRKPTDKPAAKGGAREPGGKTPKAEAFKGERIAKRLARVGVASRRDAETMIEAGQVKVNGRVLTSPAFNVGPSDRIEVNGEPLPVAERTRLFLFHKPAGLVTTTRDPEGRKTIFDILPEGLPRLITIGRLDINTEGLLLLTNDGGLARVLELPSTGWLRRYRVRVHGKVDPKALAELEQGIAVDGVFYGAITATLDRQQGSNAWLTLGLREGKNREVRNVLGALRLDVTRLIRISYGPFQLADLPEGAVQEVKGRTLRDQLGERLIEQAGANFEAPIAKPFANKPVRGDRKKSDEDKPRISKGEDSGKERKPAARRKSPEEKREEARDRLQTKRPERFERKDAAARKPQPDRPTRFSGDARPERPERERPPRGPRPERFEGRSEAVREGERDRPTRFSGDARPERSERERPSRGPRPERFEGKGEAVREGNRDRPTRFSKDARPERAERERPSGGSKPRRSADASIERRSRSSNVWMAPGARPVGKKRAEEAIEEGARKKPRAGRSEAGDNAKGGRPQGKGRAGDRPAKPGKGRRER